MVVSTLKVIVPCFRPPPQHILWLEPQYWNIGCFLHLLDYLCFYVVFTSFLWSYDQQFPGWTDTIIEIIQVKLLFT